MRKLIFVLLAASVLSVSSGCQIVWSFTAHKDWDGANAYQGPVSTTASVSFAHEI